MTEIRIAQGFASFDEPLEPQTSFADRLYATLVDELHLRPSARRTGGVGRALGQVLDDARRFVNASRWPSTRRWGVYQLVIAALLIAVLVAGLVLAGSLLRHRLTASEIVARSQAAYRTAPALTMTVRDPFRTEFTMSADGRGTWRIQRSDEAGTYYLYDGTRSATYDANQKTWGVGPATSRGGPPVPFQAEFTWATGDATPENDRATMPCRDARDLGVATVIGRPVDHIVCGDIDMEYWIDQQTSLILRMEAGPTTPHWQGADVAPVMEVVGFRLGADDPAGFSWSGPPGAFDENNPPRSTVLVTGQVAPRLTATAVDGRSIDTTRLAKPTAFLFCSALGCARRIPDFEAAATRNAGMDAVVVALEYPGTVSGFLSIHPTALAVVVDSPAGYALTTAWGLGYPEIVLLRADGTVASVIEGRYTQADWDAMFQALARGEPIPRVEPQPGPTEYPQPSAYDFGELSIRSRGFPMPTWSAPLLGGGSFDSASLLGKPSVLWFWGGWDCDGCATDDLVAFERTAKALAGRVAFVMVVNGERTTGQVEQLLRKAGLTLPPVDLRVVWDWDREVDEGVILNIVSSAFVWDKDGRLVDVTSGPPTVERLSSVVPGL